MFGVGGQRPPVQPVAQLGGGLLARHRQHLRRNLLRHRGIEVFQRVGEHPRLGQIYPPVGQSLEHLGQPVDQLPGQAFLRRGRLARPGQGERHLVNAIPRIRCGIDDLQHQTQQPRLRHGGRPIGSHQPIDQTLDRPRAHGSNLDTGYDKTE